ncbi:MAG TPA: phosphoribosylformylglycinamidine cyclo-ligase, partial [Candidatus Omnitrophica bacterium]|nr:phosphoribosylformylglycinamidine cyclo-ligase [Candidatus Omnitrophota bacterium]
PLSIKGIAHNTGGSFYNKLTKILPKKFSFKIYKNSWKIPEIFKIIQKKANLEDKEMYSTFNMGIGMVVVVEESRAFKVFNFLKKKITTYIIGEVVKREKEAIVLV